MKLYIRGGSNNWNPMTKHPNGLVVAKIDRRWVQNRREYTVTILLGLGDGTDPGNRPVT
jgi:hypothetical protein